MVPNLKLMLMQRRQMLSQARISPYAAVRAMRYTERLSAGSQLQLSLLSQVRQRVLIYYTPQLRQETLQWYLR